MMLLVDIENGSQMFAKYSEVTSDMLELRDIVMARKEPRKLLVQPNMTLSSNGTVELKTYCPSTIGMVSSWVERFENTIPDLFKLAQVSQNENFYVNDLV